MLVKQFGFRRDEIIEAKLCLGANTPAGLAIRSYVTERGAERWPRCCFMAPQTTLVRDTGLGDSSDGHDK